MLIKLDPLEIDHEMVEQAEQPELADPLLTGLPDTASTIGAVDDFVKQYNSVMEFIREKTTYDAVLKKGSILTGDSTVRSIQNTLAVLVGGVGEGLSTAVRSFSDIGITTGAIGTAVGQARKLVLDSAKLTNLLQSNPAAVADVFGALTSDVDLQAGGTGSIGSIAGVPSNHVSGTYSIVSDASGNLTATFTPADGGSATTTTGSIKAGGSNTTLIPGITLTAKDTLAAGTDTIEVSFTSKGVGVKIADYVGGLAGSAGVLANRQDSGKKQIEDVNKAIQRLEERLEDKERALYARFTALERALARFQNQSTALAAQLASLNTSRGN
jgi:flagellar hook-associated protein 2